MGDLKVTIAAPNGRRIEQPLGLFINNEFVKSSDSTTLDTINPYNEQVLASVQAASADDVDRAVKAARTAFDCSSWRDTAATERGRLLYKLADLVERDRQTLATLESLDNGMPFSWSLGEMEEVVSVFRYYAGWSDKGSGQTIETDPAKKFTFTLREPIGVCGQIVPWNYPLCMAAWKLAPAISCGNTIVLKPAEQTPLTSLFLATLVVEAGFPPGVINIVNGSGSVAGTALVNHPHVDKIAFTGSTATGKAVMKSAATSLKNISLETGGKSPLIVFEDANLTNAVKWAHYGSMGNAGQICTSTSRLFVHETVYDQFVAKFQRFVSETSILGDPFDVQTYQGPQISQVQLERILMYADSAREEGADIIQGGKVWDKRPENKGYFFEPTIVGNVTSSMKIYREEIFGPFAAILKFKDEAEVLRMANDTDYGLAGAVFTSDIARAIRVTKILSAGTVWINANNNTDFRVPFGGVKQSGIGRELGEVGFDAYSQLKSVHLNLLLEHEQ